MGNYNFKLDLNSDNTMSVIDSWIEEGTDVLEFGCANGRLTKHLAKNKKCCLTIVEIDLEAGKEAAPYAECSYLGKERGDINKFFWLNAGKKFDYIIFADVLEHLFDPQLILDKCKEVMKNNGKILVSIPNISHNSILIDLFNDKFCYSKSGLLDETHFHFFTYTTFCEMISQLGLKLIKQHAIYSRVGWNEINNSYSDVPYSVERELRNRVKGSIYQYVFAISRQEPNQEEAINNIIPLEDDIIRQEEASCFVWNDLNCIGETSRFGKVYSPYNNNVICFPINDIVEKVRIDPIEGSALIQIENILIKPKNENEVEVGIIEHNALFQVGNIFYYNISDPYIIIDTKKFHNSCLDYVKILFKILDCRMSDFQMQVYTYMFNNLSKSETKIINVTQNKELDEARKYICHLENDISQQKEYIEHLENDISQQKEYIEHLENDMSQQKDYIIHLEQELSVQAEYTGHLENDIVSQKEYVEHLEKDIAEQNASIMHIQNDIMEQKEYIAHLEKDISEQRDYIIELEQKARKGIKYIFERRKK